MSNNARSRATYVGGSGNPDPGSLNTNNNYSQGDISALGYNTRITGQYGVAVGASARITRTGAITIGYIGFGDSGGDNSVGLGSLNYVSGRNSVAIGRRDSSTSRASVSAGLFAAHYTHDNKSTSNEIHRHSEHALCFWKLGTLCIHLL